MLRKSFVSLLALAVRTVAEPVDFVRDVKPIFEAHCVSCHGAEKHKSGYRLDEKKSAFAGGESGEAAIVPGKADASPMIRFVSGADKDMFMPPKKSDAKPLSEAQITTVRRWIEEGAPWPDDAVEKSRVAANGGDPWSFQPLRKPAVPGNLPHPIDAFILAKLLQAGLTSSPAADARTLCRRVYFDLTGLPPTADEIDAFAADHDPSAYEKLVDTLLARPRYGERWARHWLDVVHYGESHGYDKDKPRPNAWPYRDYVIRAFNEDKPYARFVQEQIAGDALFPGTRDGIEALGFIAAGPWDYIGHAEVPETKVDGKIARHLDRDDMIANTIGTFCSATIHCAQCHNHKFDPITQEDYYSLQAVFAALDRTDRRYYADATLNVRFAGLTRQQSDADAALAAVEEPLKKEAGAQFDALTRRIKGASKAAAQKLGNTSPDFGYHSTVSKEQDALKWVQVDLGQRVNIESVALLPCYDDFNAIGAGFGFPVRFKVEASDDPEFETGVALLWRHHDATFMTDFKNPGLTPFITGGAKDDGIAGRYVRVTATKLAPRKGDFIFALAELRVFDASGKNIAQGQAVAALDSIEAPPRWRKSNLTDGIAPVAQSADEKEKLVQERETLLLSFADDATKTKRAALLAESRRIAGEVKKLPAPGVVYAGGIHTGSGNFIGTGANGGKPRPIFLLARGQVTQPGKELGAGALSALTFEPARFAIEPDAPEGERRAALARWITDPHNPLTWRSIVNRVWQYHFGRGIVETPNDFGKMGTPPTHPDLLDWLAVTFREDLGGSFKKLHRLIVTSATYRQQSSVQSSVDSIQTANTEHQIPNTEHSRAISLDAGNTLLWRQNRRRLEAEAIRDSILAAAGKLDLTMGGPSFQDFVITHPEHSPHYEYQLADPEDVKIQRRSIYRFIARSQQQPWMATMDCADPSMLVDRRNQTITPLQALAQLNNQLTIAMARHFAERVTALAPTPKLQIDTAFRLALQRNATDEERAALSAYAKQHGLTNACRLVLNLNEFVFVD